MPRSSSSSREWSFTIWSTIITSILSSLIPFFWRWRRSPCVSRDYMNAGNGTQSDWIDIFRSGFLHVFHHFATVLLCFAGLNSKISIVSPLLWTSAESSQALKSWAGFSLNLAIHIVMCKGHFISSPLKSWRFWRLLLLCYGLGHANLGTNWFVPLVHNSYIRTSGSDTLRRCKSFSSSSTSASCTLAVSS
jgi:hypothetical protein